MIRWVFFFFMVSKRKKTKRQNVTLNCRVEVLFFVFLFFLLCGCLSNQFSWKIKHRTFVHVLSLHTMHCSCFFFLICGFRSAQTKNSEIPLYSPAYTCFPLQMLMYTISFQ